jgi:hypothetical protein
MSSAFLDLRPALDRPTVRGFGRGFGRLTSRRLTPRCLGLSPLLKRATLPANAAAAAPPARTGVRACSTMAPTPAVDLLAPRSPCDLRGACNLERFDAAIGFEADRPAWALAWPPREVPGVRVLARAALLRVPRDPPLWRARDPLLRIAPGAALREPLGLAPLSRERLAAAFLFLELLDVVERSAMLVQRGSPGRRVSAAIRTSIGDRRGAGRTEARSS